MTTLITGGAGFIGSHLVDHLMTRGEDIRVLDNLSAGNLSNIENWLEDAVDSVSARAEIMYAR